MESKAPSRILTKNSSASANAASSKIVETSRGISRSRANRPHTAQADLKIQFEAMAGSLQNILDENEIDDNDVYSHNMGEGEGDHGALAPMALKRRSLYAGPVRVHVHPKQGGPAGSATAKRAATATSSRRTTLAATSSLAPTPRRRSLAPALAQRTPRRLKTPGSQGKSRTTAAMGAETGIGLSKSKSKSDHGMNSHSGRTDQNPMRDFHPTGGNASTLSFQRRLASALGTPSPSMMSPPSPSPRRAPTSITSSAAQRRKTHRSQAKGGKPEQEAPIRVPSVSPTLADNISDDEDDDNNNNEGEGEKEVDAYSALNQALQALREEEAVLEEEIEKMELSSAQGPIPLTKNTAASMNDATTASTASSASTHPNAQDGHGTRIEEMQRMQVKAVLARSPQWKMRLAECANPAAAEKVEKIVEPEPMQNQLRKAKTASADASADVLFLDQHCMGVGVPHPPPRPLPQTCAQLLLLQDFAEGRRSAWRGKAGQAAPLAPLADTEIEMWALPVNGPPAMSLQALSALTRSMCTNPLATHFLEQAECDEEEKEKEKEKRENEKETTTKSVGRAGDGGSNDIDVLPKFIRFSIASAMCRPKAQRPVDKTAIAV
jgi:hypothetical protein